MRIPKYVGWTSATVDAVAFALTYPWLLALSTAVAAYQTATYERGKILLKAVHFAVVGPVAIAAIVVLFPFFAVGQVMWTALCHLTEKKNFLHLRFDEDKKNEEKRSFTFVTANLLLGLDMLGKFQNMGFVYPRLKAIGNALNKQEELPLKNLEAVNQASDTVAKELTIQSVLPDTDFLLLQEVWDKFFFYSIVSKLKSKYKHFVVDVAHHSFWSNFCLGSSGLMVASRYPILNVEFLPFPNKKSWQRLISYGCVMVKVDLDHHLEVSQRKRVGYMANLHAMAYQEKENQIGVTLKDVQSAFGQFRKSTARQSEKVVFAVVAGDFNFDNISPSDRDNHGHDIFKEYKDICMEGPGRDKPWAIGTELRQLRLHDAEVSSSGSFKRVLEDDVRRRHYVIDADVEVQTFDLMYCDPKPDSNGEVKATASGGKRRIDRLLFDPSCPTEPTGVAFLTAFAGQTDHIPFGVTLVSKE